MIQLEPLSGDPRTLRQAFGCFPSGVTAVCALIDKVPIGMAASSFTSVSMDPPLVSVCVQDTSATWPKLRPRARLGVSVLAEGHDAECLSLSRKEGDRFAGVSWETTADGAVYVRGATAWLDCSVERELPAGDHAIALLRVHGLRADPGAAPLIFHGSRFRTLAAVD
ncbi:flavin reductase family protein [Saccharopolyspora spinosa]|uniref:Flavin reductase (DIM6/NTAB) family NADH-FMN oxidoreductase RutF n=1 Tax=Saccharopolyspora spinosa TaxID=60894 RepID=A0A2N3Y0T1_SACSN|nr:flavin reductase family protein [Saccharopolyspora spinosa]PKW16525.1 flavin reductase (DIM6/NTAB) family NADH-FMN oxidoreductase RutF [Saccharopolyspora spinosa]